MDQEERKFSVQSLDNNEAKVQPAEAEPAMVSDTADVFNKSFSGVETAAENVSEAAPFDDTQVFEWNADEFEYHDKGSKWLWWFIGVIVLLVVVFIFMKQWTSIVLVLVGGLVVYQYAFKRPRKLHYILTKDGLIIGEKSYSFDKFKDFWLSGEGVLYLDLKSGLPPRLTIMLESVNIDELSVFLEKYVKKETRTEGDTADSFGRWMKW